MIKRFFTDGKKNPYNYVDWAKRDVQIPNKQAVRDILFPVNFSETLRTIAMDKYFKIRQVPKAAGLSIDKLGLGGFLLYTWKQDGTSLGLRSFKQVIHRLAGTWAFLGWQQSFFKEYEQAKIFYDLMVYLMINQMFAPNSPQWFNTGLRWAYGLGSDDPGYYYIDKDNQLILYKQLVNGNRLNMKQQVSACYIHLLKDQLLGLQSITDMLTILTKLFRNGSGNGFNASNLRALGLKISQGGQTSGMMSFLKIFDKNADAVKSGGRTRRSARNRIADSDHPLILNFTNWKVKLLLKIRSLITGSKVNNLFLKKIYDCVKQKKECQDHIVLRLINHIEPNMIQKTIDLAKQGILFDFISMNNDFNGEATKTVSGQNSNNNIAIDDKFMHRLINDLLYELKFRKTGLIAKVVRARDIMTHISKRSWKVGDPGVYYIDNTNAWGTCAQTKKIVRANPCQLYLNVSDTSCNLGSLNLMKFKKGKNFLRLRFCRAVLVSYVAMLISISMSIAPSKSVAWGTHNYRPIGMGLMNLGSLLMSMAIPYDSKLGCAYGRIISSLLTGSRYKKSILVRLLKRPFPKYALNSDSVNRVLKNHYRLLKGLRYLLGVLNVNILVDFSLAPKSMYDLSLKIWKKVTLDSKKIGVRNNSVSCLRPTGTIGLMMDSSGTMSGLPEYTLKKVKKLADGGQLIMASNYILPRLKALLYTLSQILLIILYIKRNETIEGAPYINDLHLPIFDCAVPRGNGVRSVSIDGHLNMMSAINGFISMGISKTVNVSRLTTVQQIYNLFIRGWKMGLKALTIFRDQCRMDSPLKSKTYDFLKNVDVNKIRKLYGNRLGIKPIRRKLAARRKGFTLEATVGGHKVYLRTGEYDDGTLGLIFIDLYKEGSFAKTAVNLLAKISSKRIQYGVPILLVFDVFLNVNQLPKGIVKHPNIKMSQSIFDFIGRLLSYRYMGRGDLVHKNDLIKLLIIQKSITILKKRNRMNRLYLGLQCSDCGSYNMIKSGTCFVCGLCGTTSGCS